MWSSLRSRHNIAQLQNELRSKEDHTNGNTTIFWSGKEKERGRRKWERMSFWLSRFSNALAGDVNAGKANGLSGVTDPRYWLVKQCWNGNWDGVPWCSKLWVSKMHKQQGRGEIEKKGSMLGPAESQWLKLYTVFGDECHGLSLLSKNQSNPEREDGGR